MNTRSNSVNLRKAVKSLDSLPALPLIDQGEDHRHMQAALFTSSPG